MANEFDVVVIGSGPGGYVAAIRAAQLGLKTLCIDKNPALGGTCLNIGCIPSKTLLHSTELFWKLLHEGKELGIKGEKLLFDFPALIKRKESVVHGFNEGIRALFKKNGVQVLTGHAALISPTTIQIGQETVTAKSIILATGSEPISLPFLPFDEKEVLSSTGALALDRIPKKLIVIGAGIIGVELGSVYHRLGSKVTFVEFMDRICPALDESLSKGLYDSLTKQGLSFHLSTKATFSERSGGEKPLIQRCQQHKIKNVRDRLPDKLRTVVEQRMRQAYHASSAVEAEALLAGLARELDKTHPGAAASLREGMSETLTILRLGVPPTLARTLRSTNPIESMIEICREHSKNVKRWRDGTMALRWCAAGMLEADHQFRRVNGHLHLPKLRAALDAHFTEDVSAICQDETVTAA